MLHTAGWCCRFCSISSRGWCPASLQPFNGHFSAKAECCLSLSSWRYKLNYQIRTLKSKRERVKRWSLCVRLWTLGPFQNGEMVLLGRWVGCSCTKADLLSCITGSAKLKGFIIFHCLLIHLMICSVEEWPQRHIHHTQPVWWCACVYCTAVTSALEGIHRLRLHLCLTRENGGRVWIWRMVGFTQFPANVQTSVLTVFSKITTCCSRSMFGSNGWWTPR